MAYLNDSNNKKADFDWDEINVGDFNLDHSENFFENCAILAAAFSAPAANNLLDAIDLSQNVNNLNNVNSHSNAAVDWNEIKAEAYITEHSETVCASTANKENIRGPLNWNNEPAHEIKLEVKRELQFNDIKIQEPRACLQSLEKAGVENAPLESELQLQLNLTPVLPRLEEFHCKEELDDNDDGYRPRQLNPPESSPASVQSQSPCEQEPQDDNSVNNEPLDYKVKLRLGWTPKPEKPGDGPAAVAAGAVKAPRAYECKEVYQAKREMALRQREEEERKAREFHSKPVPNFKALHKRLANTIVIHRITVPITPETVKHSYADMERRKRREQEAKMSQQQQQQENAKMVRRAMHESKPFQLRADQRVRERREYNHVVQCHQEEKKKQVNHNQDEERKQRELEETKELRRLMEFKARPNPFK
ncbi:trichohyalin isoform X3 [Drosophila montana]|uniref:trichohyalin isoform X3 n=1 Tax=Drosophila montana TaxID=40370 RepID=UPI00313BFDC8